MANKKYDYSDEMMQSTETAETSNAMAVSAATAEETRRQRLEQRNDTLANEFRSLKPEIARIYNALRGLIDKSGAFTTTMVNLMDLLKTVLPVRLTEEDMATLQKRYIPLQMTLYCKSEKNARRQMMKFIEITSAYP